MKDTNNREIDYLRISITDRCNLRCKYCLPNGVEALSDRSELLTYEEIIEVVEAGTRLGIKKIKITGGEPLVRKGCASLLGKIKSLDGIESVTLTTNGVLLADHLDELKAAGVDGINISLDTMDKKLYTEITGSDELDTVVDAINRAYNTGIKVKVNVVMADSCRKCLDWDGTFEIDDDLQKLINLSKDRNIDVRFIEIMPIGAGRDFTFIFNEILYSALKNFYPDISKDESSHGNGPAVYYNIPGFAGSIGFISAMHGKFCGNCNRIRMSSKGYVKSCLCYEDGVDLRPIVRSEKNHEERLQALTEALSKAVLLKPKEHCFEDMNRVTEQGKMSAIGG